MRIQFRAVRGYFDEQGGILGARLDTGDDWDEEDGHYLMFQRSTGGTLRPRERDGLHFEFDDQGQGDYGVVRLCRLGRTRLSVDLSGPLGELEGVGGFDVDLEIDDESFESLRTGLPRICEGTSARFESA